MTKIQMLKTGVAFSFWSLVFLISKLFRISDFVLRISDFRSRGSDLSDNKHPHNSCDGVGCKARLGCSQTGLEKFHSHPFIDLRCYCTVILSPSLRSRINYAKDLASE